MQKYQNSIQNRAGDAIYNALITVTTLAGAPVTVYSDSIGTVLSQVRTDDKGMFEFYAANGRYNLTVSGDHIIAYTLSDVLIDDSISNTIVVDTFDTVATIANLKSLIGITDNTTVSTLGYFVAGDGGHGTYYFDLSDTTSADNGGTVIVATDGGRWKLVHDGTVNALQFGAYNDGVTATSTQLNAALAASGVKNVILNAGSYLITTTLLMNTAYSTLSGVGVATIKRGMLSLTMVDVYGGNCTIEGIIFDGNKANFGTGNGCIRIFSDNNVIRKNTIHDAPNNGIMLDGRSPNSAIANNVYENVIIDCDGIGISQHTSPHGHIHNNDIRNCGKEGITIDNTSYKVRCCDNTIINCGSAGAGGIGTDHSDYSIISGNYIDMAAIGKPGITFNGTDGESNNLCVTGNTIIGTDIGVYLKKFDPWVSGSGQFVSKYNSITGNTFTNCSSGIRIGFDCVGNVCTGNTFNNCSQEFFIDNSVTSTRIDSGIVHLVARNTIQRDDVTGDGTAYTIPFEDMLYGSASYYDVTTGVFTAPIAGRYMITASVRLIGGTTHDDTVLSIVSSMTPTAIRGGTFSVDENIQSANVSAILYLRKNTTIELQVHSTGGTKTVDVQGDGANVYLMIANIG